VRRVVFEEDAGLVAAVGAAVIASEAEVLRGSYGFPGRDGAGRLGGARRGGRAGDRYRGRAGRRRRGILARLAAGTEADDGDAGDRQAGGDGCETVGGDEGRKGLAARLGGAHFDPVRWTSFSGLGREQLQRGFQRFQLGGSLPGRAVASGLAAVAGLPVQLMDRAGLGSGFEVYSVATPD